MKEDEKVKLKKSPTLVEPHYQSKERYQEILSEHIQRLSALQNLLYPSTAIHCC